MVSEGLLRRLVTPIFKTDIDKKYKICQIRNADTVNREVPNAERTTKQRLLH